MASFTQKGRTRISSKKREIQKKFVIDEDESKLFDDLLTVMKKRRNINSSVDLFMYLVNQEYTKQDRIRII